MGELEIFEKKPLGGISLKELINQLAENGEAEAEKFLAGQVDNIKPRGIKLPEDHVVLMLGGSNGILRAVAIQLLFGEGIPVYGVHYDRPRMQIGHYHVQAMKRKAEEVGIDTRWWNRDATNPEVIKEVIEIIRKRYSVVHLINGIAAGATKRYEKYGEIFIKDLDVRFHPILQVPDFSKIENIRRLGLVKVETATDKDIERTNKFMGTSTMLWAEPLAEAGLLKPGESIVAFTDYDFEKDDPVYGMGPLAGAKILQRKSMAEIRDKYKVDTVRLCYPAMDTTALGAIPGGVLMFALSAVILKENNSFKNLKELASETVTMFDGNFENGELRMDKEFQRYLPEFHERSELLKPDEIHDVFLPLTELDLP